VTRVVKNHHLQMLQDSWTDTWDTEAVQQEAKFYCANPDTADSSPKAEPW
jgi:hypothetical protein